MDIPIIFQNADWMVVDKPQGLSVHNAEDGTNLLDALSERMGCRMHAVHRLDKETSGVMLVARTSSFLGCGLQFMEATCGSKRVRIHMHMSGGSLLIPALLVML